MDVASHQRGLEMHRLLERVKRELEARAQRAPVRRQETGELEEPGHAARVVVGARLIAPHIVVRAEDDPLRTGLGKSSMHGGDDVLVLAPLDREDLAPGGEPVAPELVEEVVGRPIQALDVPEVARGLHGREALDVLLEHGRVGEPEHAAVRRLHHRVDDQDPGPDAEQGARDDQRSRDAEEPPHRAT